MAGFAPASCDPSTHGGSGRRAGNRGVAAATARRYPRPDGCGKHMAGTHWIDDPAELARRLASRNGRVGLDTEFIRERTYWP